MSDVAKCTACGGRGYFACDCWPGDCICGFGDETCDECCGDGVIYDDFHEEYDFRGEIINTTKTQGETP